VLFNHTVSIQARTWANVRGERVASVTSFSRVASVQEASAARSRTVGADGATASHRVYLPAPDPEIETGDLIAWGDRVLFVLAPAVDQGGRGRVFRVDCQERQ
jgi:hypothetical protein